MSIKNTATQWLFGGLPSIGLGGTSFSRTKPNIILSMTCNYIYNIIKHPFFKWSLVTIIIHCCLTPIFWHSIIYYIYIIYMYIYICIYIQVHMYKYIYMCRITHPVTVLYIYIPFLALCWVVMSIASRRPACLLSHDPLRQPMIPAASAWCLEKPKFRELHHSPMWVWINTYRYHFWWDEHP